MPFFYKQIDFWLFYTDFIIKTKVLFKKHIIL